MLQDMPTSVFFSLLSFVILFHFWPLHIQKTGPADTSSQVMFIGEQCILQYSRQVLPRGKCQHNSPASKQTQLTGKDQIQCILPFYRH